MTALWCSSRGITKRGVKGWGKSCLGRGPLKLVNSNPSMLVCNIYRFNLWFKSGELEWCQTQGMIPDCVFFPYLTCIVQFIAATWLYSSTQAYFPALFHMQLLPILLPWKVTSMGPQSLRRSPTWCSPTWWTRCCLTRSMLARSPGSAPHRSVKWTGRTAWSPRRRMTMRGHPSSMAYPVSKSQSTACHVK